MDNQHEIPQTLAQLAEDVCLLTIGLVEITGKGSQGPGRFPWGDPSASPAGKRAELRRCYQAAQSLGREFREQAQQQGRHEEARLAAEIIGACRAGLVTLAPVTSEAASSAGGPADARERGC